MNALHFVRRSLLDPGAWPLAPFIESITLSGSHAKGTALPHSDIDVFISYSPATPGPLSDLAPALADRFRDFLPLPRNVSVRILFEGKNLDLIPGRRRENSTHHTLWKSRTNTWIQTDISEQIRFVKSSGLIPEILALKLWTRERHLRFPSFLQELAVIQVLQPGRPMAAQWPQLLDYLATRFPTTRLTDPANSNNVVSALLLPHEKLRVADAAHRSLPGPVPGYHEVGISEA